MPRRLLKKLCPNPGSMQKRWYLRPFGDESPIRACGRSHRRAVTSAFGVGLAICFIPLPVHLLVAALIAVCWRINLPAIYGTTLLVNPLTCVPVYYTAYRVERRSWGSARRASISTRPGVVRGRAWGRSGSPSCWAASPCAIVTGLLGWLILEFVWRWRVKTKYRARHMASCRIASGADGRGGPTSASRQLPHLGHGPRRSLGRSSRPQPRGPPSPSTLRARSRKSAPIGPPDAGHASPRSGSSPTPRLSSSISAKTDSAFVPSRFPVGSSANTIFGSVTKARATAAR